MNNMLARKVLYKKYTINVFLYTYNALDSTINIYSSNDNYSILLNIITLAFGQSFVFCDCI
jgi:hypothetical protein